MSRTSLSQLPALLQQGVCKDRSTLLPSISPSGGQLGGAVGAGRTGECTIEPAAVRVAERRARSLAPASRSPAGAGPETRGSVSVWRTRRRLGGGARAALGSPAGIERMRGQPVVLGAAGQHGVGLYARAGARRRPRVTLPAARAYAHPTLAVTPEGCRWGAGRLAVTRTGDTFARTMALADRSQGEARAGLEGFERCAELAASLPDTRWSTSPTGNAISMNSMVRAQRAPGIDGGIRVTDNAPPGRGRQAADRWRRPRRRGHVHLPGPAEPAEPTGAPDGAGRPGDLHPKGGDRLLRLNRAAGTGEVPAGRGR